MITLRWVSDWRGLHLTKVWSDDYPKKGDFNLPEDVMPNEIHNLEQFGPGIRSWIYIKWLNFKYR